MLVQLFSSFCRPLDNSGDFKVVLELIYAIAAQYDSPPSYPVSQVCERIDGANEGTDILGRIFAGFVAVAGNMTCYPFKEYYTTSKLDGWTWQVSLYSYPCGLILNNNKDSNWGPSDTLSFFPFCNWIIFGQVCSELVIPVGIGVNDTMFQPDPFNLKQFINGCRSLYGVSPRSHLITTYYGGHVLFCLCLMDTPSVLKYLSGL